MRYRNKAEQDLIIAGRFVKAGEEFDSDVLIENPNFERLESAPAEAQVAPAPQAGVPPAPPVNPQPTEANK